MKDGFIKVAACTPEIQVADVDFNVDKIISQLEKCREEGVKVAVFPELCITGYTCQDLFFQNALLDKAMEGVVKIAKTTADSDMLVAVGVPVRANGKLYNCAAVMQDGEVRAFVPKTHLPNYNEFYEARHFAPYRGECAAIDLREYGQLEFIPPMEQTVFVCEEIPELVVGFELCEDLWVADPVSNYLAKAGATLICNLSASDEVIGKDSYRRQLVSNQSARLVAGYIYCSAGDGESTQDMVFSGHNIIAENGTRLAESSRFVPETVMADMDLERLNAERRRTTTYPAADRSGYQTIRFSLASSEKTSEKLLRYIDNRPFVPHNEAERSRRCEEIFTIQAMGLKKRLEHTGCSHVVLGISGGLDSTLALLVAARAFDMLDIPRKQIHAITMPCFGTTDRTYQNACQMTEKLGASLKEIDIKASVTRHFEDIGHDISVHDVTYENGQARERTQILMDIANQVGGMVIGTGDMSELALGWATYNGDHMSMYGVNVSVPKTLVRHLVRYYADACGEEALKAVLLDVLDTPVSPELLPPENGVISQKTEDLVGPYELHDFFLYYVLRFGFRPSRIYRMALQAFEGEYDRETILKWLNVFYRRFFAQQFKRSCLPDGPKVGSVAVSPRGDLRMPSDAARRIWMEDLENIH